jgi:hypothetical protein
MVSTTSGVAGDTAPEMGEVLGEDVPLSLEAITRLVEPSRMNNLMAEELTPRHLRRANRAIKRGRRDLVAIQRGAWQVQHSARAEALRGQQLARTTMGRRRARRVQVASRRASVLHAHFDALEAERARVARRVATGRDLLAAWQELPHRRGESAARMLRQTVLSLSRIERAARDRLEETRRALAHVAVAEDAMRRDADMVRMDPINFARVAGRGRWGVRLGIAAILLALVALLYPPWSPPRLALNCATGAHSCATVPAAASVRLTNTGSGVLIGWATVTNNASSQVLPLILPPHGTRILSCVDYNGCAPQATDAIHVQFTTSGGSSLVAVQP